MSSMKVWKNEACSLPKWDYKEKKSKYLEREK